ncbi:MAG TPA: hypothetical protein VF245_12840 [Solirubrobacterales bacterium]
MADGIAGVIRSGSGIRVTFKTGEGSQLDTLEGEFIGVGADLSDGGTPILLVDEDKDTDQSVSLDSVVTIEGLE